MSAIVAAARQVQTFFQERRWDFCIIGGLAVVRWGYVRATKDVDFTLLTGLGRETAMVDELLAHFHARRPDARELALSARVLLLTADNGVPIDISLAAFPYEEKIIARSSMFEFAPDIRLRIASAEDIIVLKAIASRDQDWIDVKELVQRHTKKLDWPYIETELKLLSELKEEPEIVDRLRVLRESVEK